MDSLGQIEPLVETVDHVRGPARPGIDSGKKSGEVYGTPALFIEGVVHRGGYDVSTLLEALSA